MPGRYSQPLMRVSDQHFFGKVFWIFLNAYQYFFLVCWTAMAVIVGGVIALVTRRRDWALNFANYIYARPILFMAGAKVEYRGFDKIDWTEGCVMCFTHESLLDIPLACYCVPTDFRFIAKKEVENIPLLGLYSKIMGYILLDRGKHKEAVESLNKAGDLLKAGAHVVVFAEGTRSKTGYVQNFKKGAFVLAINGKAKIIPVSLTGAREVLPPNSFKVRPHTIYVTAGTAIDAADYTYEQRDVLLKKVRDEIIKLHVADGGFPGIEELDHQEKNNKE